MKLNVPVALVLVAAAATFGAPTTAATTTTRASLSADASWRDVRRLPSGGFRATLWSVFAFSATDGTEAGASRTVVRCIRAPRGLPGDARARLHGADHQQLPGCDVEKRFFGATTLSPGAFTVAEDLSAAHLNITIDLRRIVRGRPSGPDRPTHVVVDWTSIGEPSFDDGRFHHKSGTCEFTEEFADVFRFADASGTIAEKPLGPAEFGGVTSSTFTLTEDGCEDLFGPLSARRPA